VEIRHGAKVLASPRLLRKLEVTCGRLEPLVAHEVLQYHGVDVCICKLCRERVPKLMDVETLQAQPCAPCFKDFLDGAPRKTLFALAQEESRIMI